MQQLRPLPHLPRSLRPTVRVAGLIAVILLTLGTSVPLSASPSGYWVSASFPAAGNSRFTPDLAVDSSGSKMYVSHPLVGSGNVTVQKTSTGAVDAIIPATVGTRGLLLSDDGSRLYIANNGKTGRPRNPGTASIIQVVDTRTNAVTASIETDQGAAELALSPDGKTLYTTTYQGRNAAFIDTASNAVVAKVPIPGYPSSLAITPDGSALYIGDETSGAIFVVSVAEKKVVQTIDSGLGGFCGGLQHLVPNRSGTQLFVTGCVSTEGINPKALVVLDTATRLTRNVPLAGYATDVAFSSDGREAYIVDGSESGRVLVLDAATEAITATFPVGRAPRGITVSGDGTALFIVHADSAVSRVDLTRNGRQVFTDVPAGAAFFHEISWLGNSGISTGYADGSFRPLQGVRRDAMAAFLFRRAGSPAWFVPPAVSPFSDLAPGDSFYKEITWLAYQRITTGYGDGTFRPGTAVSREAMAAFLYRYATTVTAASVYAAPATAPFSDVRPGDAFHREISWAAAAGITKGYGDGTYRPATPVSREAAAAFLYRLTNPDRPMPR